MAKKYNAEDIGKTVEFVNKRGAQMWNHILPHVDFQGKSVLDLGSGHGDFVLVSRMLGAEHVYAIENDPDKHKQIVRRLRPRKYTHVYLRDIENSQWPLTDICVLFSVLPYLINPDKVLEKMTGYETCLIECQYRGDGPDTGWAGDLLPPINDDDMRSWMKHVGFSDAKAIGKTTVEGRNVERTIWLCRGKGT